MGCCCCHPLSDVENDPSITCLAEVGYFFTYTEALAVRSGTNLCYGLMYIKDDTLCYETKCGDNLSCCCRRQFSLAAIKKVEIMQEGTLVSVGQFVSPFFFHTAGLMITCVSSFGITTLVFVGMPDAPTFGPELSRICGLTSQ